MNTAYDALREFADSWVLLLMVLFFVTAVWWAMRPSARPQHDAAAAIPFKED